MQSIPKQNVQSNTYTNYRTLYMFNFYCYSSRTYVAVNWTQIMNLLKQQSPLFNFKSTPQSTDPFYQLIYSDPINLYMCTAVVVLRWTISILSDTLAQFNCPKGQSNHQSLFLMADLMALFVEVVISQGPVGQVRPVATLA